MAVKSNFQFYLEKLPKPLRNKFLVATGIFMIWMFFFDRNSLISQYKLQSTLNELRSKKAYFKEELKIDEEKAIELHTDDRSMEKFAREEYLMKKDDEDVFVIVPK